MLDRGEAARNHFPHEILRVFMTMRWKWAEANAQTRLCQHRFRTCLRFSETNPIRGRKDVAVSSRNVAFRMAYVYSISCHGNQPRWKLSCSPPSTHLCWMFFFFPFSFPGLAAQWVLLCATRGQMVKKKVKVGGQTVAACSWCLTAPWLRRITSFGSPVGSCRHFQHHVFAR